MRDNPTSRLVAGSVVAVALMAGVGAGLGLGPMGAEALACGYECRGYGYRPAPADRAPAVYVYGPAYRAYAPGSVVGTYSTRVDIFRGPRWGYSAAYYNPSRQRGCRRHPWICGYRVTGPVISGWSGRRR